MIGSCNEIMLKMKKRINASERRGEIGSKLENYQIDQKINKIKNHWDICRCREGRA